MRPPIGLGLTLALAACGTEVQNPAPPKQLVAARFAAGAPQTG